MGTYQSATGHDAEASATNIDPQPHGSEGIFWADVVYTLGGRSYDDGTAWFKHTYNSLTDDQLAALLTRYGLSVSLAAPVRSAEVTVYTNESADYDSFRWVNAIVHRPDLEGKYRLGHYRNIEFEFTDVDVT